MSGVLIEALSAPESLGTSERHMVVDWVLGRLGAPPNLSRIDVRPLWDDHYRVNIFCREGQLGPIDHVRITDSFFLSVKPSEIITDPPIERKYA